MTLFVNKAKDETRKNTLNLVLFFNEKVLDQRLIGKSIVAKYDEKTYPYAMEDIMEWIQNDAPFINRIVADEELIPRAWIDEPFYEGRNTTVRIWSKEDFKLAYYRKEV